MACSQADGHMRDAIMVNSEFGGGRKLLAAVLTALGLLGLTLSFENGWPSWVSALLLVIASGSLHALVQMLMFNPGSVMSPPFRGSEYGGSISGRNENYFVKLMSRMSNLKYRLQLDEIRQVAGGTCRGIHKRIDENRELLELLQEKAPELLERYFWIEGWIDSNDHFLVELEKVVGVKNKMARTHAYPRPWPGRDRSGLSGNPQDTAGPSLIK